MLIDRFYCVGRYCSDIISSDFPNVSHVWISFSDPSDSKTPIHENKNRKDLIRFQCHDIEQKMSNGILFTEDMADEILRFYNQWKNKVECFIVNCEAGMSRSAGVIEALHIIESQGRSLTTTHGPQFPEDLKDFVNSRIKRRIYPNQRIKRMILNSFLRSDLQ